MKTDLLIPFDNIPYFTIEGFKQSTGMNSPQTVRVLLHRWSQAGYLFALKKGVYMTRRFYEQHRLDQDFSAAVSAILLPQSYVSLEYVLQEYNVLTEVTYPVTCVTTQNTRTITSSLGTFWYRNIRSDLYSGFVIAEYLGLRYARASLGKALFDYLYLRPIAAPYRSAKYNLADELRLNFDEIDASAQTEFSAFVDTCHSRKMYDILANFRSQQWRH